MSPYTVGPIAGGPQRVEFKGSLRGSRSGRFEFAVILALLPAILGACGSVSPGEPEDTQPQAAAAPGDTPVPGAPTQLGAPDLYGQSPEVSPARDRGSSALNAPEFYRGTGILTRGAVPPRSRVSVGEAGEVTLNFANADIGEVVAAVLGDTLGFSYLIDPKVQGQVTARTSRPIPRSAVISALENILELNGAALTRDNGIYKIVTLQEAATGLTAPVVTPANRRLARGFGLHFIPLKYASATGLAEILKPFIPTGRVFRVDAARNLFIFAGTQPEASDLIDMISIFDIDWMSGMSFALFPIKIADAEALVADLEAVFLQDGASPIAGLVRFVPIERLNSILVISPQSAYLDQARIWIERLDRGAAGVGRRLYVYHVQNGRAADLAEVLSQIFESDQRGPRRASIPAQVAPGLEAVTLTGAARRPPVPAPGATAQSQTPAAGQGRDVGGQAAVAGIFPALSGAAAYQNTSLSLDVIGASGNIRIIADEKKNALVILATSAEYQMIEATLKRLDITPLQVMIEVTIADVTLTDDLKYGLQWFFREGKHSATFSTLDTGAVASAFPGFSYLFSGGDIRVALNALTTITDVKVISSPQLMVLDNQTARLQVGDQVPIATQQSVAVEGGSAPLVNTIQFRDTGVILEVTPRVNAGGLVVLDVLQEVSDVKSTTTSALDSPTIEQRSIQSTVAVQSGETIALGGLIRDREEESVSGIPLLSAIPILGNLFKTTSTGTRRTELLVLITPRVVRDQSEARAVTEELRKRLRSIEPLQKKIAAPE